jgi:hypothetical protein
LPSIAWHRAELIEKRELQKEARALATLMGAGSEWTGIVVVAEERGTHDLKGVPEPVTLFRLVRASGGGRRAGQRHLTPLRHVDGLSMASTRPNW